MEATRKDVKVLLVSDDDRFIEKTHEFILSELGECAVVVSGSADDALDKIMANGFDITVIDTSVGSSRYISVTDVIRISRSVKKRTIIIERNAISKTIRRIKRSMVSGKSPDLDHVQTVTGKYTAEKFSGALWKSLSCEVPTARETFKRLHSDIVREKRSLFNRYKFLSFV